MGKASISIAITGSYNGAAVERAERSLDRLAVRTAASEASMSRSWVEVGSMAAEAGGRIYSTGRRVAETGDSMTAGLTVPLAAAAAASSKTAMNFESSMSRVAGALDDPNANMDELATLAKKMGQESKFSAINASAAMEELAKGGLTAADIKAGALSSTMDLAAAGGLGLAAAANTVVQSMGAFGLSAGETSAAANALAGAAAASSADVSDLTQGLSQVSAQAHSAGWTIQDTTAVLGAFADAGIKGSDAGTSLKTMLQRLSAPTGAAAKMMDSLGINVRNSDGTMKDAASIAGELSGKMSGLDSATRDAAMQTIFGADASRAALVMMNQGEDGIRRYTDATNDQRAAQRLAGSQMGETEKSIEEMNGSIENAAIGIGNALAPAVTDAANAVASAADAFSGLDDGTQSAVVGFAAVAAAAGPVLSVSGRIVKGVGSLCTAYGKARQDMAVYADAMTTTDRKQLEVYASNSKLAKALSRNPAVKAAGGVREYIEAVRRADRATSLYNSKVREYEREVKKGSKANAELIASIKGEVVQRREQMDAANGTVQGYRETASAASASSASVKASAASMKAAAVAGGVLKGAFAAIAPVAVIGAITSLAGAVKKAEEAERTAKAATDGLVSATASGISATTASADAFGRLGQAAKATRDSIRETVGQQAELSNTIKETNVSAGAQMGQLQGAYSVIEQYANKSGLSADEQGRLKSAVDYVNDSCGTQISVTDGVNGRLSDQNGAIQDVTTSIGDYVQKKMEQIRIDAYQDNLSGLYKQQADDVQQLAQAQAQYNAQVDKRMQAHPDWTRQQAESSLAVSQEKQNLDEARGALEAVNTSISNTEASMGAAVAATDGASASLQNLVMSSPTVTAAISSCGGDVRAFAQDVSDAGLSVEDFRNLNAEQLSDLVVRWSGGKESISQILSEMGTAYGENGAAAVKAWRSGFTSDQEGVLQSAMSVSHTSLDQFYNAVQYYGITGADSVVKFAAAVAEGDTFSAAAQKAGESVSGFETAESPSQTAGSTSGANFASGLASGGRFSGSNAQQMADAVSGVLSASPGAASSYGASTGSNYASGIVRFTGAANSAGSSLADAASAMNRDSGSSGEWGSHLAQNFASGIKRGVTWVSNAARSVVEAAKKVMGFSVPDDGPWSGSERGGETSGLHLAQNFARGMLSGAGEVSGAARSLMAASSLDAPVYGSRIRAGRPASLAAGEGSTEALLAEMVNLLREIASKDMTARIDAGHVSAAIAATARTTRTGRGFR